MKFLRTKAPSKSLQLDNSFKYSFDSERKLTVSYSYPVYIMTVRSELGTCLPKLCVLGQMQWCLFRPNGHMLAIHALFSNKELTAFPVTVHLQE